jgi:hypothetical protein
MRIVDPDDMNALSLTNDRHAFVEQDAKSKIFEIGNDKNRIVIAEHPKDVAADVPSQLSPCPHGGTMIPERETAIVAREDASVVSQSRSEFDDPLHRPLVRICMQIAQMENCKAMEGLGQSRTRDSVAPNLDSSRVTLSQPVKTRELEADPEN